MIFPGSDTVDRFLSDNMTIADEEQLAMQAGLDNEFCARLADQQTIHRILVLLAEEQNSPNRFVDRCMAGLSPDVIESEFIVDSDRPDYRQVHQAKQVLLSLLAASIAAILMCYWVLENSQFTHPGNTAGIATVKDSATENLVVDSIHDNLAATQPSPEYNSLEDLHPEAKTGWRQSAN